MVIFHHNPVFPELRPEAYGIISFLNRIGWAGVDLFFVLSGFLVGGLLIDEFMKSGRIRVKRFIYRRGFKVWPVYYAFLIAWCSFQIIFYQKSLSAIVFRFWPNFLHIQNYFSSTSDIGWLWSLGVEEHFYLFLPFLMTLFLVRKGKGYKPRLNGLTALFALTLCFGFLIRGLTWIYYGGGDSTYDFVFPTHLRVDGLFSGVCLALFTRFQPLFIGKLARFRFIFLGLGLSLLFIPYHFGHSQTFLYPWGLGLMTLAFTFVTLSAHCIHLSSWKPNRLTLFFGRILAFVGLRSYSIYVWHGFWAKPIAHRLTQFIGLTPETEFFGIFYECTYWLVPIFLGTLSFHCIEEPFLKLRHKVVP